MKDECYMAEAVRIAGLGEGQTRPNPLVGAVLVKDGEIIGFGAHLKAGLAHAEVNALHMAGARAAGSTLYVTLEPCSHYGKTPPCAEAVIQAGVKRVVIASLDPNPLVSGNGIRLLKDAGIEVVTGVLKKEADRLNEVFFAYIQQKQPFVTVKQAVTLDGKLAVQQGAGEPITGWEVQQDVHRERERHDAVLTGIGTVLADDPQLNNRYGRTKRQPVRVILDTHLRMPLSSNIINDSLSPVWIFTGADVSEDKILRMNRPHVEIIQLETPEIMLEKVLDILGERQISKLYVEGGARVNASFLKSGLVNQWITYVAPKIIGGNEGVPLADFLGVTGIEEAYRLDFKDIETIGEDVKIISVLK